MISNNFFSIYTRIGALNTIVRFEIERGGRSECLYFLFCTAAVSASVKTAHAHSLWLHSYCESTVLNAPRGEFLMTPVYNESNRVQDCVFAYYVYSRRNPASDTLEFNKPLESTQVQRNIRFQHKLFRRGEYSMYNFPLPLRVADPIFHPHLKWRFLVQLAAALLPGEANIQSIPRESQSKRKVRIYFSALAQVKYRYFMRTVHFTHIQLKRYTVSLFLLCICRVFTVPKHESLLSLARTRVRMEWNFAVVYIYSAYSHFSRYDWVRLPIAL